MKTNWLWDKNVTEEHAKEILADIKHPQFIAYAALLLSRLNSAKDVFSNFLTRENFFVFWSEIKRQMRKDSWNDPRIDYWQAIYETMKEEMPELSELKVPPPGSFIAKESIYPGPREIGLKIKALREQSGLTQKDLANKLKISQQIISRIESGRQNVSVETLNTICASLGVPVSVIFQDQQILDRETVKTVPFSSKSPEEFVKMVFEIVDGLKGEYGEVQYYERVGDKGRDIVAYKYCVGKKEQWYFQCKRYSGISFSVFKLEIDKIIKHSQEDKDFHPDGIVFVTACKVSPKSKDDTKAYAKKSGLKEVIFWTDVELTAKAKTAGIYDEFFPITNKKLEEASEDIKAHITSELSKAGSLTAKSASKQDQINKGIDEAVKEIDKKNIETAKQILLNIKGKIEDDPGQYNKEIVRTYNNLGVCYNRFKDDGGDFGEAEKYFRLALERDPSFIKAKVNLVSVYLNKGDFRQAYEWGGSLWNLSDKKDPQIFQEFILSKFHFQSSKDAVEFYENSTEAKSLVETNEILSNLMGTIYLGEKNFIKAHELADQALALAPNTPRNLMLKARAFMQEAQTQDVIKGAFEVIPRFKDYGNIHKANDLLNQATEILKRNADVSSENQIKYDLSICMLWLRRWEEFEIIREGIDSSQLDPAQMAQLNINDVLVEIQRRNFETAWASLKDCNDWTRLPYKEKARIAHILLLKGAPQQSKEILLTVELEAEKRKDIWFYIDMSLNEVLLTNKHLAIEYAQKAKRFAADSSQEKIVWPHYNALMMRYTRDNEVDRLMEGIWEQQQKFPEEKIVWSIKAIEEDGAVSDELKSMLLERKQWYENVKRTFRDHLLPSYFLEKILKRTYIEILSCRSWDDLDFAIPLTLSDKSFEENLLSHLDRAGNLVFDYASLLNLSKMNLLGYLEKLGKGIFISERLFDKIQYELVQVEQEDLRNLWRFLKDSKAIHIVEDAPIISEEKKYHDLLDEWIVESLCLARNNKAALVIDDLRLLNFFQSEEDIKCCNSFIILKSFLKREWIDIKIYSTSIGDLAERFYTFLPFSGEDLFRIVMEDKSKISPRSCHLVNELFLPGSVVASFTSVFVEFIDLLWQTGSFPKDKVDWISFLTDKMSRFLEMRIGEGSKQDLEKVVPDFVQMWIVAVQRSGKDEILLLEGQADQIFDAPIYRSFKDNISRFIKSKKISLGME